MTITLALILGVITSLAVYCVCLWVSAPRPTSRFGETAPGATVGLLIEGSVMTLVLGTVCVWLIIFKTGGV